jgi:glutamate dehydrogenase
MGYFWDEETVEKRLETIMIRSFSEVARMAAEHKVSLRIAAYMLGINRVAICTKMRGIYA